MSFTRGQRAACVAAGTFASDAPRVLAEDGFAPLVPRVGAVYRIRQLLEKRGRLWLFLAEEPRFIVYLADHFRPAVEGEDELERLRGLLDRAPAERELADAGAAR